MTSLQLIVIIMSPSCSSWPGGFCFPSGVRLRHLARFLPAFFDMLLRVYRFNFLSNFGLYLSVHNGGNGGGSTPKYPGTDKSFPPSQELSTNGRMSNSALMLFGLFKTSDWTC